MLDQPLSWSFGGSSAAARIDHVGGTVTCDVTFAGPIKGRVIGSVRGVDYLRVRADSRVDIDIRATIELTTGTGLAFLPTAWGRHAQVSRLPIYVRTCVLLQQPRATTGSTCVRPGAWAT